MRQTTLLFILCILIPSVALAWLAIRSLQDQQFVLERQQAMIYQNVAQLAAERIRNQVARQLDVYNQQVDRMIEERQPDLVAHDFDALIKNQWRLAEVGFAVTLEGRILSPSRENGVEAARFLRENELFLGNREVVEVYQKVANSSFTAPQGMNMNMAQSQIDLPMNSSSSSEMQTRQNDKLDAKNESSWPGAKLNANVKPIERKTVQKARLYGSEKEATQVYSTLMPEEAEFKTLVGKDNSGTLARFLQNRLHVLFWHRPSKAPDIVFGCQVRLKELGAQMMPLLDIEDYSNRVCIVLLDDMGRPVAKSVPDYEAPRWKEPFVAVEVGEVLPHWEVAIYYLNPKRLDEAASTLRWTLGTLIGLLVVTNSIGGWLLARDIRRQIQLASQKTDFVSNVSHELKTPLTSIRMFSEMLADGRVRDESKQRHYLHIICAEAARLTRLINNVLDFNRMERGQKQYKMEAFDLGDLVTEVCEFYRPHLEQQGFQLDYRHAESDTPVHGDRDGISQVLVNLISNAEKYSGDGRDVLVEVLREGAEAVVRVSDRGLGVPDGAEKKIFEQFYRAHDSLGSGIQGSGLGLTLARQIARAHEGEISYAARHGGGSCFEFRIPMMKTGGQ